MIDDLIPIVKDCEAQKDITIYPICDLHYGSRQFMGKKWDAFVSRICSENNSYIVVAGDLMNNALKSSVSNVYEETCRPAEQKRWLAEQLEPIKGKILCGCGGNHERRSTKDADDDPLYDVFCKLDVEERYRENAAFLILRIGGGDNSKTSKTRPTYTFCVTHGSGGGMYIGSSGNKLERYGSIIDGLDCLVTGHTHKPLTFPVGKLRIDPQNKKVSQTQFTVVQATSWLEYGGYPIQKMLTPTAHCLAEIRLSAVGKQIRVLQ